MSFIINVLLFFILIPCNAQTSNFLLENTDVYFIYCGNGDGYFKKVEWKQMGDGKPVFLKKLKDTFRVEVFFDRDELYNNHLTKVKGTDVIRSFLRKDEMRSNGKYILDGFDRAMFESKNLLHLGSNFYLSLYVVRKNAAQAEVLKTAIDSCNESARKVQGTGDVSFIKNKKTNQLLELEIGSAEN